MNSTSSSSVSVIPQRTYKETFFKWISPPLFKSSTSITIPSTSTTPSITITPTSTTIPSTSTATTSTATTSTTIPSTSVYPQSLYYMDYCSAIENCVHPSTCYPLRRQLPLRIGLHGLASILRELSELGSMLSEDIVLVEYKIQPVDKEDTIALTTESEKQQKHLLSATEAATTDPLSTLILVGGDPCYLASEKDKNLYIKVRLTECVGYMVMNWDTIYDWQHYLRRAEEDITSDLTMATQMKVCLPQLYSIYKNHGSTTQTAAYFLCNVLWHNNASSTRSRFDPETGEGYYIHLGKETVEMRWAYIDSEDRGNISQDLTQIFLERKRRKWKFVRTTQKSIFHLLMEKNKGDKNETVAKGEYVHPWFVVFWN